MMGLIGCPEFDSYKYLFLATNNKREKIYCGFKGRIFRFLMTTRISISGIHNYSNYPFWNFTTIRVYAELPHAMQ